MGARLQSSARQLYEYLFGNMCGLWFSRLYRLIYGDEYLTCQRVSTFSPTDRELESTSPNQISFRRKRSLTVLKNHVI
jgi:hypothetical protein